MAMLGLSFCYALFYGAGSTALKEVQITVTKRQATGKNCNLIIYEYGQEYG